MRDKMWGWVLGAVGLGLALGVGATAITGRLVAQPLTPAAIYAAVAPSVVSVRADGSGGRVGSAFAIDARHLVTALHIVHGADRVVVRTLAGEEHIAFVVGSDARTDLALLESDAPIFEPARLGSSSDLRVGDRVLAIGNPYGLEHTLSVGVVSSMGRWVDTDGPGRLRYLQLGMGLHPGSSGGPVIDDGGEVVAVLTGTHAKGAGIAFAVSVESLVEVLPALRQGQRVTRAFLGLRVHTVEGHLTIRQVAPSGPAGQAGLRVGDRMQSIDGQPIPDGAALRVLVDRLSAGAPVLVGVERGDETMAIEVVLGDWARHGVAVGGMTLRAEAGTGGRVVAVRPRSRADRAGVREGDTLRWVNGVPVHAPADVQDLIATRPNVLLGVVRDGFVVELELR